MNFGKRSLCTWKAAINQANLLIADHRPTHEERFLFRAFMNSYLGLLSQYDTYVVTQRMLNLVSPLWTKFFIIAAGNKKLLLAIARPPEET